MQSQNQFRNIHQGAYFRILFYFLLLFKQKSVKGLNLQSQRQHQNILRGGNDINFNYFLPFNLYLKFLLSQKVFLHQMYTVLNIIFHSFASSTSDFLTIFLPLFLVKIT